mmetsp:Transcript_19554/g.26844  ORF Transcript_19554/g.26844 Transcript_19554/m.26844 type:complete len:450 (-) Transcript_19554:117-1466(-)|eukprot:CAMPEP_0185732864 /NCGR_PEP_ID=MMETSP1171-20130828/17763_1 /TAXON_ID=374046 /ORGANISM="Helicotheca tamensis, Strain CCMP826" /LENGTH=449 /DNA_ID=CAMNT_0028402461 /DNA_START=318 /DNA_END=1667 /DNA_ORIENTATION=+
MKYSLYTLSLILLSALPSNVDADHDHDHGHDHDHETLLWDEGDIKMPYPLSDMSANVVSTNSDKFIVIVGGCDYEDGNVFVEDETYGDFFACFSITDKVLKFSPKDGTFTSLRNAPRQRYRHAGVEIGGKLWVVGGRDVEDNLIAEIDVYDPEENTWSTPISLPPEYLTSDNAAFIDSSGKKLFVAGGWNQGYVALDTTFSIDVDSALNGIVNIEKKASLVTARGDIHAASTADQSYAYVTGGFTDKNVYCAPMSSVERYIIDSDKWETVSSLNTPRGDKALVQMNGRIFAIGGERKLEEVCDESKKDELPHMGDQSVPVDDAEVLDPSEGIDAKWMVLKDLPQFRFRFQAAPWDESNTLYTFGGQKMYDKDCNCFATSDALVSYIDEHTHDENNNLSGGAIFGIVAASLVVFGLLVFLFIKWGSKKNEIEKQGPATETFEAEDSEDAP